MLLFVTFSFFNLLSRLSRFIVRLEECHDTGSDFVFADWLKLLPFRSLVASAPVWLVIVAALATTATTLSVIHVSARVLLLYVLRLPARVAVVPSLIISVPVILLIATF